MLTNLNHPTNTFIGIADKVLLAPLSWFVEVKAPEPPYINPGDQVTIWSDHVFKGTKGFIEIVLAPEKNSLSAPAIGDPLFRKFDQQLEIFIPGSSSQVHETVKGLINTPLIVLAMDANCLEPLYYQLGNPHVSAFAKMDFTTGTTREGVKGYKGTIYFVNGYIQIYKGHIRYNGDAISGLSAVFLANESVEELPANISHLETYSLTAQSSDISEIYNLLLTQADQSVIQVAFASGNDSRADVLIPVDLSTEESFIASLYDWLAIYGDGQYLQRETDRLMLYDENAGSGFMGIAVPRHLLGDDNILLLADDDTLIKVQ